MRPTETQLAGYEAALVSNLQKAVRALPLVQLIDVAPQPRRTGAYSDACAADQHSTCRAECDCNCHEQWEGYAPNLPDNYQGIRNHPVGKTWHDHDDTSDRALSRKRPSREWLERFAKIEHELSWLARNAIDLVGEPVETCPCTRPILDHEPTVKSQGATWHRRCYDRKRKGKPVASTSR